MTILHELVISVETNGIRVQLYAYPTKFTGKNYVPQTIPSGPEGQKFSCGLKQRVKADEIMKVRRGYLFNSYDHISRSIYFLDGSLDEAKALVKASLEEAINRMKAQVDLVHSAWHARIMRPVGEPRKNFPSHSDQSLEVKA